MGIPIEVTEKCKILTSDSKPKKERSTKKRKLTISSNSQLDDVNIIQDKNTDEKTDQQLGSLRRSSSKEIVNEISEKRSSTKRKTIPDEIEVDITAPEPPSKKKLRLLNKKKPSLSVKLDKTTGDPNDIKKDKEFGTKKKSNHGIWIGNLSYQVSTDDIHKFLVDNSEISDDMISRIYMPEIRGVKSTQKAAEKNEKKVTNKGFAYVDFSSAEAVNLAVKLSEKLLFGRRVLIKDNKSFEGRPDKGKDELKVNNEPLSKKIFLGNLSFDTTEGILKEHFERCGAIKTLKVATFEDSGKCKGFAWIVFEEIQAAKNAVRGFIKINNTIDENISDHTSEEDSSKKSSSRPNGKKIQSKVWVNRIKGRTLRIEFAEDAQLRYNKRYGKDRTKNSRDINKETQGTTDDNQVKPLKKVDYRQEYAPRLTGGIIESKGKKITF
ncbi:putative rna binding protein [Erysiphe necator]|uniref:Putative rna binding protein n=1 Tax=Uncinula necator TaxID=52586 RepID=A0A0B1PC63_UNCNE|nr:putative rna binding protein [Erysiphe necator]